MIKPSITELTQGKFNRYTLSVATAKCARMITDEYVKERELAEHCIANKETDKSIASMVNKDYRDEKAVKLAVNGLYKKDFVIVGLTDDGIDDDDSESAEEASGENTEAGEEATDAENN